MNPPAGSDPHIRTLGDAALLIELGTSIGPESHERVRSVLAALEREPLPGVTEVVPAYTTIAVHYDPVLLNDNGVSDDALRAAIRERLRNATASAADPPRTVRIPVRYGGADGPDLADVARHTSLAPDEVVRRHAAATYTVHMIGFAPGFPYLAGLPPELATPRRATPRERVAAGSVGIAGAQTGVYPLALPGGWQLIGRTDVPLFDPAADPPTLLRAGDRVRFEPL